MRTLASALLLTALLCFAAATLARAEFADQRTTELLTALHAGDGTPSPDEYSIPNYVAPEVIERIARFIKS
jgi:hypothetical protein